MQNNTLDKRKKKAKFRIEHLDITAKKRVKETEQTVNETEKAGVMRYFQLLILLTIQFQVSG